MVVQLARPQLAQPQQDVARRPRRLGLREVGDAEAPLQGWVLERGQLSQDRLGQVGQRRRRGPRVVLAQDVADADAEQLLVLEAVENRIRIRSAAA